MMNCLQTKQYEICRKLENESDLKKVKEMLVCVNQIYTAMGCENEETATAVRVETREDPQKERIIADLVEANEQQKRKIQEMDE